MIVLLPVIQRLRRLINRVSNRFVTTHNNPRGFRTGKLTAQYHRQREPDNLTQMLYLLAQRFQGSAQHGFILMSVRLADIHHGQLSGLAGLLFVNIANHIAQPVNVIHPQPPALRGFAQGVSLE